MFLPSEYRDISSRDLLSHIFNNHTETDTSNPIYIDAANPSNSLSRAQCRLLVRQLIAGLRHLGVKPGHSVAVHAYNSIYYGPLFLAIVGAGGVYVGSNPAYTEAELAHLFAISDVKFIFTGPELVERILPPSRRHGIPEQHILVFDADSPTLTTPSDVHGPIQQSSPIREHLERNTSSLTSDLRDHRPTQGSFVKPLQLCCTIHHDSRPQAKAILRAPPSVPSLLPRLCGPFSEHRPVI